MKILTAIWECALFSGGTVLGVWYSAFMLIPLFYGLPRALREYCAGRLTSFKPVLRCLLQPLIGTILVFVAAVIFALAWSSAFYYLYGNAFFNFGNAVGGVFTVVKLLFNKKTHADMRQEYEELVQPYRRLKSQCTTFC